jgi:phosphoglycolate phosphatase-like HAD superfamily hydrolase
LGRAAEPQELERLALRLSELVHETHGASPIQPMRGAAAAIAALEEAGFAVALASGGWKATAEAKLRAAGLDLDRLPRAFADDHEERRGIIETARARAATRLGADGFSRTVYVGDAIWDLVTTRDMRIPFVGIAAGAKGERLVADGAHHVLPDYSDGAAFMAAVRAARPPSGI